MPHYRFFIETPLYEHATSFVEGPEYHHMTKVMRLREGDPIELVNGQGYLAHAIINRLEKERAHCFIQNLIFQPSTPHPFIIAQAILKPASLELTVEKNTELGAGDLWIFPSLHSEKKSVTEHQLERLYKHTVSALKQCGRLYLPEIKIFSSLAEILKNAQLQILYGDVSSTAPALAHMQRDLSKKTLFVVGPEQGFHENEIDLLKRSQAEGVSLHPNILRAETASLVASALLSTI
jgi:16S rRNA (uracil1498-N3)-methyltransferase